MSDISTISPREALLTTVGVSAAPRLTVASEKKGAWSAVDTKIAALVADRVLAGVTIAYIANTDEPIGTPEKLSAMMDDLRVAATNAIFAR